ncbi:MAG: hypothetical protein ACD_3C00083G0024 [uncultured bacterium (gcode 4)]|uniref:Glycosyl transferase family 8 n=1 Tax=uncultured bacterium (gcode 4) TaxID=1234023 RepID=K2GXV2_9BACT|nr:MAG: hypothetical protein ACD_3C00083G0024 [uncultured bacterium (gcode 4)]
MDFLICFNEWFYKYWLTLIYSVIKNNKNVKCNFHIITDSLSENAKKNIKRLENASTWIFIHEFDISEFENLKTCVHLNKYVYLRLMLDKIPNINKLSKIIYLDSDMLCIKPIEDLKDISLGDCIVWAMWSKPDENIERKTTLNTSNYFNSWFMIIDVNKWIDFWVSEKTLSFIEKNPKLLQFLDQDGLNVVLDKKVHFLDVKYNYPYHNLKNMSYSDICVIHYAWNIKPWNCYYYLRWWVVYTYYYSLANKSPFALLKILSQSISFVIMKSDLLQYAVRHVFLFLKARKKQS